MTVLNVTGNCTIQFSQSAADQEFSLPVTNPLNSSFQLPLMESSTLYHLRITFDWDLESVALNTSYMTPKSQGILIL